MAKKKKTLKSNQRWRNKKDASGKIQKGKKRTSRLTRTGEKGRYQTIIHLLSDYYKKAKLDWLFMILIYIFVLWLIILFAGGIN